LTPSQSDSRTSAVLVDELDACSLEGSSYHFNRGATRLADTCFELMYRHNSDTGLISKLLLRPT
jgi:hypothetical protein